MEDFQNTSALQLMSKRGALLAIMHLIGKPPPNQSVETNAQTGWPADGHGCMMSSSQLREGRFQRVAHLRR